MFEERLTEVRDRIAGALALSLVAQDGIAVETVGSGGDINLEALAAEMLSQAQKISDDHLDLSLGRVRRLSVATERYTILVSALTGNYYLLAVLEGGANLGRARFELQRAALLFEDDLQ